MTNEEDDKKIMNEQRPIVSKLIVDMITSQPDLRVEIFTAGFQYYSAALMQEGGVSYKDYCRIIHETAEAFKPIWDKEE